MTKIPIDNKDGTIVTLSLERAGVEHEMSYYAGDKEIQNEGELKSISLKAAKLLWEYLESIKQK